MRRALLITVVVIVGFFSIILYRLPAAWVVPRPPAPVGCTIVAGSLWRGQCSGLIVQGQTLGNATWTLHPAALLTGLLSAHVVLNGERLAATADVATRSSRRITLTNLVADLPLDPAVLPQVPRTLSGHVHLDLSRVTLQGAAVTELAGRIEARDLTERSGGQTALGSYALTFPPGAQGDPVGELRDLPGSPLNVEGTLQLTPRPGYRLQARVGARPGAPPAVQQSLQVLKYMGSPDSQGRYPYAQEGLF